jgi:hypothetical protein
MGITLGLTDFHWAVMSQRYFLNTQPEQLQTWFGSATAAKPKERSMMSGTFTLAERFTDASPI